MGDYDWRLADTNVWKVERMLLDLPAPADPVVEPAGERAPGAIPGVQGAVPGRKPLFYRHGPMDAAAGGIR